MEREPSIHVTRSVLIKLTHELGIKLSKPNIDRIMKAAREVSADNRTMIAKANQTKNMKNMEGSLGDANLAAQIIYSIRVKLKHVGVTKIKQTDTAWGQIRQLTPTLNQFCENHQLDKRAGYIAFLELGFKLMEKSKRPNYNYCASWMLKQAGYIDEAYKANESVREDEYPQNTRELMSYYQAKASEMTGMFIDYSKNTTDYVHFVGARKMADKWGIDYETYIDAQFASLTFCNGIPRIPDLDNEKAEQRLAQYVAKQGITLHRSTLSENTWDKFKQ